MQETHLLHIAIRYLAKNWKYINGAIMVLVAVTTFIATRTITPFVKRLDAHESRIAVLEQTLPVISENTQIIADFINQPKVKLLRPLVTPSIKQ